MSPFGDIVEKSPSDDMLIRTATDLGSLLRERRRKLGLDQRAAAEKIGVSRKWLIEVEQGKEGAELGLVLRAVEALGLRIELGEGTVSADDGVPPAPDIDAIVRRHRR